jgi:Caspase domain/Domain of unknown function (DUF4384)
MNNRFSLVTIALLAITGAASNPLLAADRVLVMGISEYRGNSNLPGVRYDVPNAQKLAKKLGFNAQQPVVLREEELTAANFIPNFKRFTNSIANGDRVFIYYSGHGMRVRQTNGQCKVGLLSTDSQMIDEDLINAEISALRNRAQEVTVFFDACHAGGALSEYRSRSSPPSVEWPWKEKAVPMKQGEVCETPSNFLSRSVQVVKNEPTFSAAAKNFTFIAAASASEWAIDHSTSGGVATNAVLNCLDNGVGTVDGKTASMRDLVSCAQGSINELIPKIKRADGKGWQGVNLFMDGNKERPLWAVSTTQAPIALASAEKISNSATKVNFNDALAAMRKLESDSDGRWNFKIENVPTEAAAGTTFEVPYSAAQGGYFYVLATSSDGTQFNLLYPFDAQALRFRAATRGYVGGDPPYGTGGSLRIKIEGPPSDNHFLVIVSPKPMDFDRIFSAPKGGARAAKSSDVVAISSEMKTAQSRGSSGEESSPSLLTGSGGSLNGSYGAAMFMVRGK